MIGNLAPRSEQAENKAVEQTDRRRRRTSTRLVFAHHMDRFVAGDCAPGSAERAKMLACTYPALDRPMILFQNVVEIIAPVDAGNSPPEPPRP